MKAIIYDCEIKNAIPDKNEPLRPHINYCKGWEDHLGMGISVIGVFDYHVGQDRIFCEGNLSDFAALVDQRLNHYVRARKTLRVGNCVRRSSHGSILQR